MNDITSRVFDLIAQEEKRQGETIELIASENFVSEDVKKAVGSCLTNKYAEGLPGKRYYGGCEVVDMVEDLCRETWKKVFETDYHVNVQPHSGSQANLAAYQAGQPLPNMFVGMVLGGEGLAVNLAILLFSHRKELKEIAKIGIIPYIFNISEPTNFGIPIIMNPNFFIPYLITPVIGWVLTHGFQLIGFLGYNNGTQVAWTLPTTVQAFFYYGWQGAVVNIIISICVFLLYIPFVKMNDASLDRADAEAEKE